MIKLTKSLCGGLIALFLGLMGPFPVQATPVEYSVSGEAAGPLANQAGHLLSITGFMTIDDVPVVVNPPQSPILIYGVASFGLSIDQQYAFSGTGGVGLLSDESETIWHLYGTGYWSVWEGDMLSPSFFHEDGAPYNTQTDDFTQLAPLIHVTLMGPDDTVPKDTIFFDPFNPSEGLFLSAVPIPPSLWLLASGLVGLAGLRRRFRA